MLPVLLDIDQLKYLGNEHSVVDSLNRIMVIWRGPLMFWARLLIIRDAFFLPCFFFFKTSRCIIKLPK